MDLTAMLFGDFPADVQAKTHAGEAPIVYVGASVEPVEHVGEI
jgi:hypothetical protein